MNYTSLDIARAFLELAERDGVQTITHMKLQKLVFFAQLKSVVQNINNPLHTDTTQAWKYGPVCPTLFHHVKHLGTPILQVGTQPVKDILQDATALSVIEQDEYAITIIRWAWRQFKDYSAYKLSALTHLTDSPWSVVYNKKKYGEITHKIMLKYKLGRVE